VRLIVAKSILCFACLFSFLASSAVAQEDSNDKSRIFVHVMMQDDERQVDDVLAAVDPETGDWSGIVERGSRARVSSDGKMIAFVRKGKIGICPTEDSSNIDWVLKSDGYPVWAPDGSQILSSASNGRNDSGPRFETKQVVLGGDNQEVTTEIPDTELVFDWSPDGKWLATASRRDAAKKMGWQLYVMRPDGSEARYLTRWGVNYHARFSPDGKQIAYTDNSRSKERIKVVDLATEETTEIFQAPKALRMNGFSWSPDGKQIVISASDWRDWHIKDDGSRRFPGPEPFDPNYRLIVIDADGKNQRDLKIDLVDGDELIHLGVPHWR